MKRKGFTLVEVLSVIVVIGILSALMMLSSSEAVSSARAAQITANMRSLQTAALAYYMDNMATADSASATDRWNGILRYLKDDDSAEIGDGDYSLDTGNGWHIKYEFKGAAKSDTRLKGKVQGRAAAVGLKKSNEVDANKIAIYDGKGDSVYLQVR